MKFIADVFLGHPSEEAEARFIKVKGEARESEGLRNHSLEEVNVPISRVEGSALGKHTVRILAGQYFRVPEGKFKAIDFHRKLDELSIYSRALTEKKLLKLAPESGR